MRREDLRKDLYVKFTPSPYSYGPKMPYDAYTTKYGHVRLIEEDPAGFTKVLVRVDEPLFYTSLSSKTGPTGAWVRVEALEEASPLDKFIRLASDERTQIQEG